MRTTLTMDDDLLRVAKAMARAKSTTLGAVVCDLARKGLAATPAARRRGGFPVFAVGRCARPITLDDVRKVEDEP
jgi:hypothetical protein